MKTKFKTLISMLLIVCMSIALIGCGSSKKETSIFGTWISTINLQEMIEDELSDEEMMEYFDFSKLSLSLVLELNKDNSYSLYVDESSVETCYNNLTDCMEDAMDALCQDYYSMSLSDLAEASGVSSDDFMDSLMESSGLGYDDFKESLDDSFTSGTFTIDGSTLVFDEDEFMDFSFSGNKLTLESYTSDSSSDTLDGLLPLEFQRK